MNPLVKKQTDQILELLRRLREAYDERADESCKAAAARNKLKQENWRQRRDLAALQHMAEDYHDLQKDHDSLQDRQDRLRQHLRDLLAFVKALSAGLRQ